MTELAKPRTQGSYSQAEIHRALVEVAACAGNTHAAARNLAADDSAPSVAQKTLWEWSKRTRTEDYERIRAEALPAITAQAAEQHMDLAQRQTEASSDFLQEITNRMAKMEDKDLVNAMGKFDIGSGIHTEKARLLSGQPTAIVKRDASEVLRKLESRGVIDAEVVEEESLESGSSAVAVPHSA